MSDNTFQWTVIGVTIPGLLWLLLCTIVAIVDLNWRTFVGGLLMTIGYEIVVGIVIVTPLLYFWGKDYMSRY